MDKVRQPGQVGPLCQPSHYRGHLVTSMWNLKLTFTSVLPSLQKFSIYFLLQSLCSCLIFLMIFSFNSADFPTLPMKLVITLWMKAEYYYVLPLPAMLIERFAICIWIVRQSWALHQPEDQPTTSQSILYSRHGTLSPGLIKYVSGRHSYIAQCSPAQPQNLLLRATYWIH